mgnify:CR=1 FL=1
MSLDENEDLVRRFIDEVMNAGNTAAIAGSCVAGSMFWGGIEGQVKTMRMAFPDHHLTIDHIVAETNRVAVRVTTDRTNTGSMAGFPGFGRFEAPVPPTGRAARGSTIYVFAVSKGKIASLATEMAQSGLLWQLGWTFSPPDET